MKKEKDFKVNLSSVQRASNKNIDSRYQVLGEQKRRKTNVNKTDGDFKPFVAQKRGRKKHVEITISTSSDVSHNNNKESNDSNIEPKELLPKKRRGRKTKKISIEDSVVKESHTESSPKEKEAEEKFSLTKHGLSKEQVTKNDFIGFLNKKSEEIKSIFSEIGSYISSLIKTVEGKDKELDEIKKNLEVEIQNTESARKETQQLQTSLLSIQEQLSKKDIQINSLKTKIEELKTKTVKKVSLVKKSKIALQIKNMTINEDGSKDFNFGVRKPVTNCEELLSGNAWEKYLINKWVHEYNPTEGKDVFYKHILQNSRVIQIVYSGLDILGDGVYVLYKARLYERNEDFYVDPQEFNLLVGSFECEDFLGELLARKLITVEEKEMLSAHTKREKFKENLPFMNEKILPNK